MKKLNVLGAIIGFAVIASIAGYAAARPAGISLAAQAQVGQITESLTNLWQKIGQNIFPTGLDWNVGIGTKTPSEKLSVAGTIESISGGFKFPDGTLQQTAQLVGPPGPQGQQGPPGPPGTLGAGNIAFQAGLKVIRTDGTIWFWNNGWIFDTNLPAVPVPVSDIVHYTGLELIDINGDMWSSSGHSSYWTNVGHP